MDPRLAANLAALQTAREAIAEPEETEVVLTSEETKAREDAARLADQERKRRPTPEEQAKAWKARNREFRKQRSITIREPEEAVRIWLKGIRRRTGGDRPTESGARSPRSGQTAEEQIIAKVQQTYATFDYAEGLEAAIRAWPLPMPFYDPVPPLCGMEEELLADPRVYEPPPVEEADRETIVEGDGRLMAGMRRAEDDGLQG